MATIFDRVQLFYSTTDFRFSPKKYKLLHNRLKRHFDLKESEDKLTYVDVFENGEAMYQVRNYPESYTENIDRFIVKSYEKIISNLPKKPPKKRSRIPINNKIQYSVKPSKTD